MKKCIFLVLFLVVSSGNIYAQKNKITAIDNFAELTTGIGSSQVTVSAGYIYNRKLGKRKRWELGLGARFTAYFGNGLYFRTAPAKLTSGKTGPAVLFADDIDENIDSVKFNRAQVNALNLSLNFGYNFSTRFSAGLTIDAIGFSFGKKQNAVYYANNSVTGMPVTARPTAFNLLLISDNDKGSLNSELFARYEWNDSWGVKLGFQFLFAEYTTDTRAQTTPGGDMNDRFRKKMSGAAIGVTYKFKK